MFDKPLFSRKQLNIIIVVTAIAIVLLSATGQRPALPEIERKTVLQVPLYLTESEAPEWRLNFSFSLPSHSDGDSLNIRLLHSWMRQVILSLDNVPVVAERRIAFQLRSTSDRILLSLQPGPAGTEEAPALEDELQPLLIQLWRRLQEAPEQQKWSLERQEQQARLYLQEQQRNPARQQLQSWMLPDRLNQPAEFSEWLDLKQQLLGRSNLRTSALTDDPQSITSLLNQTLSELPEGLPWQQPSTPLSSQRQQTQSILGSAELWMARPTLGRVDPEFGEQQLALRALQQLSRQLNIAFEWTAGGPQSQLILHLSSQNPVSSQQALTVLLNALGQTEDAVLETVRQNMIDSLYEIGQNPVSLNEQLESLAFYQLPTDYLQQLATRLTTITAADMRHRIADLLQPQDYHWIAQNPGN